MAQSVYIIAPRRAGPVKIGIARDPARRLATFQTAHWGRLYLFSNIRTGNARMLETAVHRRLKPLRLKGEWFDISVAEARVALRQTAGANRFGPTAWIRRALLARRIGRGVTKHRRSP
jgi:hypothetical protein